MGQLSPDQGHGVGGSADDPSSAGTTIVGGQPPGHKRRSLVNVPVGVEKVLYAAAIDRGFRQALLGDREQALRSRDFGLRDSELAMLRLTPAAQLEAAIDALDVSPRNLERRQFMRAVAVAVTTIAAGEALGGCDGSGKSAADAAVDAAVDRGRGWDSAGVRPDLPPDGSLPVDRPWSADGIRPDLSFLDGPQPAGIRPDAVCDTLPLAEDGSVRGIRPD
jgi:hypothetical protein